MQAGVLVGMPGRIGRQEAGLRASVPRGDACVLLGGGIGNCKWRAPPLTPQLPRHHLNRNPTSERRSQTQASRLWISCSACCSSTPGDASPWTTRSGTPGWQLCMTRQPSQWPEVRWAVTDGADADGWLVGEGLTPAGPDAPVGSPMRGKLPSLPPVQTHRRRSEIPLPHTSSHNREQEPSSSISRTRNWTSRPCGAWSWTKLLATASGSRHPRRPWQCMPQHSGGRSGRAVCTF